MLAVLLAAGSLNGCTQAEDACRETGSVPFAFYSAVNPENSYLTLHVPCGDCLFEEDATTYSHALAQASLGLAFSNFRENGVPPERQGYALREYLTAIGFDDIQADQYDVDTTSDTVASMIARRETTVGGEPCTIIAVSICGAGYDNEWLSNFAFSGDDRHAGFDKAADKVLGRLLLYLFNHPAEGKVKLWISGYSRAAAIANLLGQKLSSGKIVPVEDLYVYTFAAPNTATVPSPWPCPSIFNIVGAFDPVPTVPPAEWGYTRYGTTLYLTAQEVDSRYAEKRHAVETTYFDLTGIPYWNNPNCNWILQKLLQILYSNITSAELYSSFVKDIISGMWVTSGILPRIRLLSDMMTASDDTDSSVRSLFSSFKEILSPYLYNLLTRSGSDEDMYWGKGVSMLTQVMHEHSPDVYCAWMTSPVAPGDLFIASPSYRRISLLPGLKIDGISRMESDGLHAVQDISGISFDINTVVNIPGDRTYVMALSAEREISGEEMAVNSYVLPSLEATTALITMTLPAGGSALLILPESGIPELRLGADLSGGSEGVSVIQTYLDTADERKAALFEYNRSGWIARNLIDLLLWNSVLWLCILAFFIIRVNIRRKQGVFYVRRAFLSLMAAFFLLDQLLRNFFPWGVLSIIICQGICSVSGAVISFFAWRQKKDRYTLLMFIAMLCYTAGDVITRTNSLFATVCYALGHLLLCTAFLFERRPKRKHYMILLASAAAVFAVEIVTIPEAGRLVQTMIYSVLLLSMAVFSSFRSKSALTGGLLFLFADLLLTMKNVLNAPGWLFLLTLGSYYLSIAVLSSDAFGEAGTIPIKPRVPRKPRGGTGRARKTEERKRARNAGKDRPAYGAWLLFALWLVILADCLLIDAREACLLSGGMAALMLPAALIRRHSSHKPARILRFTASALSAALHLFVTGVIVFLFVFAGTHAADGSEANMVFLLGSDLKNDKPGALYVSRIDTAEQCLREDPSLTLIACGGLTGTNTVTESAAARTQLIAKGIAPERIICEDRSTRTLDNFAYAAELLEASGTWNRALPTAVITNRFHFYRTTRLAQAAGYETLRLIPAGCKLQTGLPWLVREVMAVTKYWFCGPN